MSKNVDEKFCPDCGKVIKVKAEICPNCGIRQSETPKAVKQSSKSRILAIMITLFVGGIGIHKLYLGQYLQGFMYFLFSWTAIPLVLSVIDIVRLSMMTDQEFEEKYITNVE